MANIVEEKEVLFGPGSRFRVIETEKVSHPMTGDGLTIWLEEI